MIFINSSITSRRVWKLDACIFPAGSRSMKIGAIWPKTVAAALF